MSETTEENDNSAPGQSQSSWEAEIGRLEIVDPEQVRIWRDPFRHLCVSVRQPLEAGTEGPGEEKTFVDVRPARVFPVSGAAGFISFLDAKDREVVMLRDDCGLDEETRRLLTEEMDRAYFVPRIIQIHHIEDAHGASRWEVETDRGYRIFDVRDREDVRVLEGHRVLLQDADGNRYEIGDIRELDERSQRLLDGEI
jgi:hypothetical protein